MEQTESGVWKDSIVRKLIIPIVITWAVLATIFAFTDLQISIALVDPSSEWAEFVADYGEWPGWGMVVIAIILIFGAQEREGKKNLLILVLMVVVTSILLIYLILKEIDDHGDLAGFELYYYLIPVGGLILGGILYFIFKKYQSETFQPYLKFALITLLLAIINPLVFVQIIKEVWGRVRFRDLAVGYTNFTPWYLPTSLSSLGYGDGSSFPSGHTAMGWMFLPLLILVKDKDKIIKILVAAFSIFWGVFVALGRIVIGAHYASDTLFSSGMAAIVMIVLYYAFFYYKKKS